MIKIKCCILSSNTGAPKLINSDLFLEKRATVPIGTVARFSRNKSLLISFGAPVLQTKFKPSSTIVQAEYVNFAVFSGR